MMMDRANRDGMDQQRHRIRYQFVPLLDWVVPYRINLRALNLNKFNFRDYMLLDAPET